MVNFNNGNSYKPLHIHKTANFLGNLNCNKKQNQLTLLTGSIHIYKKEHMQFILGEVTWIHIQKLCPSKVLRIIFLSSKKDEKVLLRSCKIISHEGKQGK